MSGMGRHVSFDQAVAWKVLGEDSNIHCLAFCFVNWSFVWLKPNPSGGYGELTPFFLYGKSSAVTKGICCMH
jgi:hypothetical protein